MIKFTTFKLFLLCIVIQCVFLQSVTQNCNNFEGDNQCHSGTQTDNTPDFVNRTFQTPPRGDPLYRDSYQDYNLLVGYAQTFYSNDRSSARVYFNVTLNSRVFSSISYSVKFTFADGAEQDDANFYVTSANQTSNLNAKCVVYDSNNKQMAQLVLDPISFIWLHPVINQPEQYQNGQKGAIVEMFGWPFKEIEKECPTLGKSGWMGVKVFPPQEAILDFEHPENGELNPWYWLYQPVSYRMHSRQGTQDELISMIDTCRKSGVRVYADAVTNHMTGGGNDMFPSHCVGQNFWGNKNSSGGSPWYTQSFAYEIWNVSGARPGNEYPAVPWGPMDFHCDRVLNSWTDPFDLNYGWLTGLCDLNTEKDNVRQRIADYLTQLISLGFSGIRMDAAKHMSPDNLAAIFKKFKDNLGGGELPQDFQAYLEVIIGGEKDLLECTENPYDYGTYFANSMSQAGLSQNDINKIKIWSSDYPKEFPICGSWVIPAQRLAVENDCHDDQFPGSSSRDMADKGSVLVKDRDEQKHRSFEVLLFTRTDGDWTTKLLLSSYSFMDNPQAFGPPDGLSDCAMCVGDLCSNCKNSMKYVPAYDPNSCGYDVFQNGQWVQGMWTRVHRDMQIINAMRQWMGLSTNLTPEELGLPSHCASTQENVTKFLQN